MMLAPVRVGFRHHRQEFDRHVAKVTGNLGPLEQEILEAEKHLHAERQRLILVQRKLKERWRRHTQRWARCFTKRLPSRDAAPSG